MLHSRNRRLRRLSRLGAFFVIVGAGCAYQTSKVWNALKKATSSHEFLTKSPLVPPAVKGAYEKSQEL